MPIKLVAFDFDRVLTPLDSPAFVQKEIGELEMARTLPVLYYGGMAKAKTLNEREQIVRTLQRKGFAAMKRHSLSEIRGACGKVFLQRNARQLFAFLRKNRIKIAVFTATPDFLMESILSKNKLEPDLLFSSKSSRKNGRLCWLPYVLTPLEKEKRLRSLLRRLHLKPSECLVVGDSLSEEFMFKLVGKSNSVAFHYKPNVKKLAKHAFFRENDKRADLFVIAKLVKKINAEN